MFLKTRFSDLYGFFPLVPVVIRSVENEKTIDWQSHQEENSKQNIVDFFGKEFPGFVDFVRIFPFVNALKDLAEKVLILGTVQSWSMFKTESSLVAFSSSFIFVWNKKDNFLSVWFSTPTCEFRGRFSQSRKPKTFISYTNTSLCFFGSFFPALLLMK